MNDPLQDNRIYPDEIKKETNTSEKSSSHLTWLWTLLIILVLIALAWFGYRYFTKNTTQPTLIENTSQPNPQQQQETFDSLEESAPPLERVERQEKINTLFGN